MKTLAIDIETYSSVSLQKCGVYAYAQSPDFEILLFGYAWDDGPVEVIDLAKGQSLPQELQDALYDPEILKTAFNASFERTCLSAFMGRVTPPEQWSCTAVMARELGLPGSLEAVGEVIGLPEDKQKSKTGRALIRYFSIPCKPTKTNGNKAQPETLQKEYVKNILANYKVGMSAIADLLGVPVSTCTSRLHKLGFSFPRGFKPVREDLERFREDFGLTERVAPTKK